MWSSKKVQVRVNQVVFMFDELILIIQREFALYKKSYESNVA